MLCSAAVPLLPPTGVTFSVSGHFSSKNSSVMELIVVAQNRLTLYKMCSPPSSLERTRTSRESHNRAVDTDEGQNSYLRFEMECSFYSPPLAVATCRPANCDADLIVMLFDDAHVSFLKYNARGKVFDTVALVQLLDRELLKENCELPPLLRMDPSGTYVAVLAKRTTIVSFPLLGFGKDKSPVDKKSIDSRSSFDDVILQKSEKEGTILAKGVVRSPPKKALQLNDWGDSESEEDREKNAKEEERDAADNKKNQGVCKEVEGSSTSNSNTSKKENSHGGKVAAAVSVEGEHVLHIGTISSFLLEEISPKIRNVRDFHFVASSGEPLFVVLYEKYPTWAGRVKVLEWGKDAVENHMLTCSLTWISISHAQTAAPQLLPIGDVDHLSYSTTHIFPFSSFEGMGDISTSVICVSANQVVWVSPQRGLACYINDYGEEEVKNVTSTSWTFKKMEWSPPSLESSIDFTKTNLNFGNAAIIPLSPLWASTTHDDATGKGISLSSSSLSMLRVLLITEEEGTAVMLQMGVEGSAVRHMRASILLTGCYCSAYAPLVNGLLFLGSCCSDSLVVNVADGKEALHVVHVLRGQPTISPIHAVAQVDDEASASLSSHSTGGSGALLADKQGLSSPYDPLFRHIAVPSAPRETSDASPYAPEVPIPSMNKVTDIAVTFGKGILGSLGILRQSLRDHLVPTGRPLFASAAFFIPGASEKIRNEQEASSQQRDFLLTSGPNFSLYFCIHDRIEQVRGPAIREKHRTVYAAALEWKLTTLLQVTERELVLVSLDGTTAFHSALLETLVLAPQQPCGAIRTVFQVPAEQSVYILFESGLLAAVRVKPSSFVARVVQEEVFAAAYWRKKDRVVVLSQGNDLVLYRPKVHREVSRFPLFGLLPILSEQDVPVPVSPLPSRLEKEPLPVITHLYVFDHPTPSASSSISSAQEHGATLVCILNSGELVTYEYVAADDYGGNRWLKEVFHFLDVDPEVEIIETLEVKKQRLESERRNREKEGEVNEQSPLDYCGSVRISEFANIYQQAGVYVCGKNPVFLFYDTFRCRLSLCRHHTQGTVQSFSFFDTPHVPGGYAYCLAHHTRVQFALPSPFGSYIGNGWSLYTTPLGETPHQVFHVPEAQSCMVVTSTPEPFAFQKASFDFSLSVSVNADGNKCTSVRPNPVLPPLTSTGSTPVPLNDRYSIKLIAHKNAADDMVESQEEMPGVMDTLQLESNEKVLCGKVLQLFCNVSIDGVSETLSNVYAFGTGFPLGEDTTTVGRLLMLTTRVEKGKHALEVLHSEPLKGPVTALTAIKHHIAVAVAGTIRVFSFDWKMRRCETVAMLYAGAYITVLSSLKEYLFFGDLFSSVRMARFSATHHTLTVLGKDLHRFPIMKCEPMYHERNFGVVSTDAKRNVVFFGYTPRVQEMMDGNRVLLESILTVDSEYRVPGGSVSQLLRFRSCSRSNSSRLLYTTNYGEIGVFVGLSASSNRTLQWVEKRLQSQIPHLAGLTPQIFFSTPKECPRWDLSAKQQVIYAPLVDNLYRLDIRTRKALAIAALTQVDKAFRIGTTLQKDAWIL